MRSVKREAKSDLKILTWEIARMDLPTAEKTKRWERSVVVGGGGGAMCGSGARGSSLRHSEFEILLDNGGEIWSGG